MLASFNNLHPGYIKSVNNKFSSYVASPSLLSITYYLYVWLLAQSCMVFTVHATYLTIKIHVLITVIVIKILLI